MPQTRRLLLLAFAMVCVVSVLGAPPQPAAAAPSVYPYRWAAAAVNLGHTRTHSHGEGVIVAVIDSGVTPTPSLAPNLLPGIGFSSSGTSSDTADHSGHGTAVASIIAGTDGVAPAASILPVRIDPDNGGGRVGDAIIWAVDHGAEVINVSLAIYNASVTAEAAAYADAHGVPIVAAAGNGGAEAPAIYPAAHPAVVAVGASTRDNLIAEFSQHGDHLDLVAPGEGVLVTARDGRRQLLGGTSLAAPHVAGAFALLLAAHPAADSRQIRAALEATAYDLDQPGIDRASGHGLIDIDTADTWLSLLETGNTPDGPAAAWEPSTITGLGRVEIDGTDLRVSLPGGELSAVYTDDGVLLPAAGDGSYIARNAATRNRRHTFVLVDGSGQLHLARRITVRPERPAVRTQRSSGNTWRLTIDARRGTGQTSWVCSALSCESREKTTSRLAVRSRLIVTVNGKARLVTGRQVIQVRAKQGARVSVRVVTDAGTSLASAAVRLR